MTGSARWSAAGVLLSLLVVTCPGPSAAAKADPPAASAAPAAADGWHDLGRVRVPPSGLLTDASSSGVVLVAGTRRPAGGRPVTTLVRRLPDGSWHRAKVAVGSPVAVDVAATGDALVVGSRGRATVAVVWRRSAAAPRTWTLVRPDQSPARYTTVSLATNAAGDAAVLVTPAPGRGDAATLVRRPVGQPWGRPQQVGRAGNRGALDSVAVTDGGAVLGAFKQDQTLSLRRMAPGKGRFGAATKVTTWSEVDDQPGSVRESLATVTVGVAGDVATTWQVAEPGEGSELVHTRLSILPEHGRRWSHDYDRADTGPEVRAVGRDGSVLVEDGIEVLRWEPGTRRLHGRGTAFLRDTDARGDALLGSGVYGGRLRLWPVGDVRGPEVASPAGRTLAMRLTAEHRVYALVVPDDGPDRLRLLSRRL